jgi:uncharacterized membrane protein YdjX (TVP38/TMEM64 family)
MKWFERYKWLILILVLIIGFLVQSYISEGFVHSLTNNDVDALVLTVQSYGGYGLLAYLILVILEVIVAPIPGLALYAAGGILFGAFWGGLIATAGNLIGAGICFKIAEKWGRKRFEKNVDKKKLDRFNRYADKYGVLAMFFLRINPFTSSDIFSYVAGFTRMKFRNFLFGTFLGLTPLVFINSYIGFEFVKGNSLLYLLFLLLCVVYFIVFFWGLSALFKKRK